METENQNINTETTAELTHKPNERNGQAYLAINFIQVSKLKIIKF